ncbi:hypothetical protein [Streptomyces ossamyceticus]
MQPGPAPVCVDAVEPREDGQGPLPREDGQGPLPREDGRAAVAGGPAARR